MQAVFQTAVTWQEEMASLKASPTPKDVQLIAAITSLDQMDAPTMVPPALGIERGLELGTFSGGMSEVFEQAATKIHDKFMEGDISPEESVSYPHAPPQRVP
jgi:hypothetical protein